MSSDTVNFLCLSAMVAVSTQYFLDALSAILIGIGGYSIAAFSYKPSSRSVFLEAHHFQIVNLWNVNLLNANFCKTIWVVIAIGMAQNCTAALPKLAVVWNFLLTNLYTKSKL
jgi:hypothetical protein